MHGGRATETKPCTSTNETANALEIGLLSSVRYGCFLSLSVLSSLLLFQTRVALLPGVIDCFVSMMYAARGTLLCQ